MFVVRCYVNCMLSYGSSVKSSYRLSISNVQNVGSCVKCGLADWPMGKLWTEKLRTVIAAPRVK